MSALGPRYERSLRHVGGVALHVGETVREAADGAADILALTYPRVCPRLRQHVLRSAAWRLVNALRDGEVMWPLVHPDTLPEHRAEIDLAWATSMIASHAATWLELRLEVRQAFPWKYADPEGRWC